MKIALSLVLAMAIQVATWAPAAQAQAPCRFVLGFGDLAARLGPGIVGTCVEDQQTATGPDTMVFNSGLRLAILPGAAFQRTTAGMFYWSPDANLTFFTDGTYRYSLEPSGVATLTWDELAARNAP